MKLQHNDLTAELGWDTPLQYYYLTVTRGEKILYSNLDDPTATTGTYGGGLNLTQLQAKLAHHGFSVEEATLRGLPTPSAHLSPVTRQLLEQLNREDE